MFIVFTHFTFIHIFTVRFKFISVFTFPAVLYFFLQLWLHLRSFYFCPKNALQYFTEWKSNGDTFSGLVCMKMPFFDVSWGGDFHWAQNSRPVVLSLHTLTLHLLYVDFHYDDRCRFCWCFFRIIDLPLLEWF